MDLKNKIENKWISVLRGNRSGLSIRVLDNEKIQE
jgi:hypothetical protein